MSLSLNAPKEEYNGAQDQRVSMLGERAAERGPSYSLDTAFPFLTFVNQGDARPRKIGLTEIRGP